MCLRAFCINQTGRSRIFEGVYGVFGSPPCSKYFPWDQILILFVSATEKYFSTFLNKRGYFQVLQW